MSMIRSQRDRRVHGSCTAPLTAFFFRPYPICSSTGCTQEPAPWHGRLPWPLLGCGRGQPQCAQTP